MGLIFLSWIWIALVTVGLGKFLCDRFPALHPIQKLGLEWVLLLGICFLSWLLALASLGFSIGLPVQLAVSLLAGLYIIFHVKSFSALFRDYLRSFAFPLPAGALIFLFGILTLLHAAQAPAFSDSGLYHIQFVKWIQNYAVIPGLGNLHGRLAFNAHVHLLSAFFSPANYGPTALQQSFSCFLFFLFVCCHVRMITRCLQQNDTRLIFYAGALVLVFIGYRPVISSPMPDSSVSLLVLLVLGLLLEKVKAQTMADLDAAFYLLVILFFTAITFKLSAVYLGFILIYFFLITAASCRPGFIKILAGLGLLICVPWLARNVVLSGYLYYPFPMPDLLGLDWVIPAAKVKWELWEIIYFNRWPAADWQKIMHSDVGTWFPFWLSRQEKTDQLLLFAVLLVSVCQLGLFFVSRRRFKREAACLHLSLLFSLASICWFFSAPAFRFGYGYLIGAVLLGVLTWLRPGMPAYFLYPVLLVCFGYAGNGIRNEVLKLTPHQLVWPGDYPRAHALKQQAGQLVVWVPPSGRCWDAPIPCTLALEPGLEPRGSRLEDGFRINKKYHGGK